jgi:hypothetical protein
VTAPEFRADDKADLDALIADDLDIDTHRQAIADRHVMDAGGPVMLALSRIAGQCEAIAIEVRFIRNHLGGEL